MDSRELRKKFIEFFENKGHKLIPSASLIPENDPSVLFNSAGMQQFKRYYINPDEAPAENVVTCQPCFRTSDIDEVGDNTHLTFFEMLGNFSFGGYFKKEAIEWGYEFLTSELKIEPVRIWCSFFAGDEINAKDEESAKILESMGLKSKEHNREDNFWGPTGDEGPCGPTVEFYVDDIEIWNLVFNEYYKEAHGSYRALETKGVDTGMGLERMLVVKNNLSDVYQIDLSETIIKKIETINGLDYVYGDKSDEDYLKEDKQCWVDVRKQFRIIADHIKASAFVINENILPSNKDRGYIIRRLIRRAIVKASQLKIDKNFIKDIATEVFRTYDKVYQFDKDKVLSELEKEETKFRNTLTQGLKNLISKKELSGLDLFNLYQSFGLPMEVSLEEAKRQNINILKNAEADFQVEFKKHQDLSRTASAGMFKGGLAGGGEMETKYHTATHLLLASLRKILNKDIIQKGSNITAERLRFDFNYPDKLTSEQIKQIEDEVNGNIQSDLLVDNEEMLYEDAKKCGATGIFENKYGNLVKVYSIADISKEICGGPHVGRTSQLGHFKITKEESSSAGVRRIKAILE